MIKIQHEKLNLIASEYTDSVATEILARVNELKKMTLIINSNKIFAEKDVEGHVNKLYKAIFVLKNIPSDKATTAKLINELNSIHKNTAWVARIKEVEKCLLYFSNIDLIKEIVGSEASKLKSLQYKHINCSHLNQDDQLYKFLFSYNDFYEDYIKQIGLKLNISTCPYCNRQYIGAINDLNNKFVVGPTYDHFFSKVKYQLLSLSFYNLVPSCYVCNSNIKHTKEFDIDTNIHPYENEFGSDAIFDFNLSNDRAKINFIPIVKVIAQNGSAAYKRLIKSKGLDGSGSIDVLRINEIYHMHSDVVEEIHEKFEQNSPYYLKSLHEILMGIQSDEESFYRYHFANYLNETDFNRRPLSKLTKDIYNKMKKVYLQQYLILKK